jgi:hypothetical protein
LNVLKHTAEVMLESGATVQVPVNQLEAPRRSGGVSCDVGGGNCCKTKRPGAAGEKSGPASARGEDRLN